MLASIRNFVRNDRIASKARFYAVLAFLVLAASFAGLNGTLQDVDESYFSFVARDSFEANSWLLQIKLGQPTIIKAPMVFWASMLSFKLFGVSDFAAKLPSALANAITVFVFFFICLRVFNSPRTAFCAALVYLCSLQVHISSHQVCTDVHYQLYMLLTLLFLMKGVGGKRFWFVVAGVTDGLVFLSKEGLGLILPAAFLLFILFDRRFDLVVHLAVFFVVSLAVSLPFYVAVYLRIPETFVEAFLENYLFKVASGGKGFRPLRVPYYMLYYVVLLVVMLLPFSSGFFHILFRRREEVGTRDIIWKGDSKLLSMFFVANFAGYSLIGQHMAHYTLPMIPALALYVAHASLQRKAPKSVYLGNAVLAGIALAAFAAYAASRLKRNPAWTDVVVGLLVIYALFTALNVFLHGRKTPAIPGVFLAVTSFFALFTVNAAVTVPMDFNRDLREFASVYEHPAPLYMVRTRALDETGKQNPLYWYMRTRGEGYRNFESFAGAASGVQKGSYIIFYKGDADRMRGLLPSLSVLRTGRIWSIAKYE